MATKFGRKNPFPEHNALLGNAANATEHYAAAGALVILLKGGDLWVRLFVPLCVSSCFDLRS